MLHPAGEFVGGRAGCGARHGNWGDVWGEAVRPPSLWGRWRLAAGAVGDCLRDGAPGRGQWRARPADAGYSRQSQAAREGRVRQRQPGGNGHRDHRHRLARPHARPEGRVGREARRHVARRHQRPGRRRRPARWLDQQPGPGPRPQCPSREARWLARRVVRRPVPAVQRRRDQRAGGQHRGLQQHRQPAAAQPHRAPRGLVPAGDGAGRAVDADRPKHAVATISATSRGPSRSPIRTRTFRP